jgi:hypothetical protein
MALAKPVLKLRNIEMHSPEIAAELEAKGIR